MEFKQDNDYEKGFFDNPVLMFFIGPPVYLIATAIFGYDIFYRSYINQKGKKKRRIFLSLGSLFYLVLILEMLFS